MAGRYRAYPEYRDSGVEWIGKIPTDWWLTRIKFITKCLDGTRVPLNSEERGKMRGDIPYWGANKVVDYVNDFLFDEELVLLGEDGAPFFDKNKDVSFNVSGKIWPNNHVHVLRPIKAEIEPRFLKYAINCADFHLYISGSTRDKLNQSDMNEIYIRSCPLSEQKGIANFLDHETATIDTLIEKQQQLIKLLKEKRQAVISHAVTKGLNPNAPMRDSGIEWLGEVPAHWEVRRLKHTSKIQSGIPKGKDLADKVSINIPMLRVANVQDGYLDLNEIHEMEIEPDQLERYLLKYGDVLMNEGGDNDKLGRGAVWKSEIDPCIHQNHVFAIRSYSVEPEWLDLLTRASYAKFHFLRVAKQSTNLASISSSNIKETPLVIPPENERSEITKYILEKNEVFKKVEEKCSTQILLLKERRTALISAAVTGKIDVRDWQPPQSN